MQTKSILFASKRRAKNIRQFSSKYKNINIKQHSEVTYLGCALEKTMSGEPMSLKVVNKINRKLKFLYRKNRFLRPELPRMLYNALIQPHFDYACPAWYPNLTEKMKKKNKKKNKKKTNKLCKINKILPTTGQMHHISKQYFRILVTYQ